MSVRIIMLSNGYLRCKWDMKLNNALITIAKHHNTTINKPINLSKLHKIGCIQNIPFTSNDCDKNFL